MILAIIEQNDGKLKPGTNELLAFAQRAGREFGLPTAALVLGADISSLVEELKTRKIDRILVVDDPALS